MISLPVHRHLDRRALSVIPTVKALQTTTRINDHAADHDYQHSGRGIFLLVTRSIAPDCIWNDDGPDTV